jgi:hypothetical protein
MILRKAEKRKEKNNSTFGGGAGLLERSRCLAAQGPFPSGSGLSYICAVFLFPFLNDSLVSAGDFFGAS